jgi:hypothetical protein
VILGRIFMDLVLLLWDFLISNLVVYSTAAPASETLGAVAPVRVAPGVPTAPTQRPSLTVRRSILSSHLRQIARTEALQAYHCCQQVYFPSLLWFPSLLFLQHVYSRNLFD